MRFTFCLLAVTVLTFGAHALARGDDEAPAASDVEKDIAELKAHVEAQSLELGFLRSRETALTTYVLRNSDRADSITKLVGTMRRLGFEANRIPVDSRIALTRGLEALASDLRTDLPALSKEQQATLKKLKAFRKAHGIK